MSTSGHHAELLRLSNPQLSALRHVAEITARDKLRVRDGLKRALSQGGVEVKVFDELMSAFRSQAHVQLHFHPDRLNRSRQTVAEALLMEGRYRNQFETGVSSGSLTPYRGGERDFWEKRLFGGAYHAPDLPLSER